MKNLNQWLLPGDYRVISGKMIAKAPRQAVFIDLDGTLWPDNGPGTILADPNIDKDALLRLKEISSHGVQLIGITNQTYFGYQSRLNPWVVLNYRKKIKRLVQNNVLDAVYICHHHPDSKIHHLKTDCPKRKPNVGLVDWATEECGIDLTKSYLVGDRITDIIAALDSKISRSFLIFNPKCLEWNISVSANSRRLIAFEVSRNLSDALSSFEETFS